MGKGPRHPREQRGRGDNAEKGSLDTRWTKGVLVFVSVDFSF